MFREKELSKIAEADVVVEICVEYFTQGYNEVLKEAGRPFVIIGGQRVPMMKSTR